MSSQKEKSEKNNDCIFCKIARKEIPAEIVYEDEYSLAFLDINPNVDGMTLVIPKEHFNSYIFNMQDNEYCRLLTIAKKVAKMLDKALNVKRTAMVMEGLGVDHAHIKLYPIYGLGKNFQEIWAKETVFFKEYQGYITTQLGPKASQDHLKKIAEKIRSVL